MAKAPAARGQAFAALVSQIGELNSRICELATQAAGDGTDRPYLQLLGVTLERVNRRLGAVRSGPADTADLSELLADISAVQSTLRKHTLAQPGYAPERIFEALARIRRKPTADDVLDAVPAELCAAGFDRAMISDVRGSQWVPRLLFLSDGNDSGFNRELGHYIADLEIPLVSPMVEAEIVRRRLPALVTDAQHEPRTFRPLMEASQTREYVVAPIVVGGSVLGLLHADTYLSRRPLSTVDRDSLWIFAGGVGLIHERAVLTSRMTRQRGCLAEAFRAAEQVLDVSVGELARIPGPAIRTARAIGSFDAAAQAVSEITARPEPEVLAQLTAREREVLALLASGATNAQVADRLTVAESTVKSHVKHILHKMGTPNRASAIAHYMHMKNYERRG
jgi:DNA-binding CsgD family transcriptional regulator